MYQKKNENKMIPLSDNLDSVSLTYNAAGNILMMAIYISHAWEETMQEKTRVHLIVSGRVQGVCFRAETQKVASRVGVTGWVRNRRDGTVEADVEGVKQDVISLIDWCKSGPPISRVEHVEVTWKEYQGVMDTFSVRY